MTLLEAIAHQEGFYVIGSRPQRNNNPGDLVYSSEAIRFGANAHDAGYAIFPSKLIGWQALKRWLSIPGHIIDGKLVSGYLGGTIAQIIYRFAPPNENDTEAYITYLCEKTGYTRDTIVTESLLELPTEI